MEPIKAMCRACERVLLLSEIPELGNGSCPTCGALLAPGYTNLLLDEARRAQLLQRDFLASLRRLSDLPGNLVLDRNAVYEALAAELTTAEQRAVDAAIADRERRRLRHAVRQWPTLRHQGRARVTPGLVAGLRALAQRVRLIGVANQDGEQAVLREAAQAVDDAAEAIGAEKLHAHLKAAAALDKVPAALDKASAAMAATADDRSSIEGADDVAVAA